MTENTQGAAKSCFRISLSFLRLGAESAETIEVAEGDFFDPLEPGEAADCDSPPRHLEMASYVDATPADLAWLRLSITNVETGARRTLEERYWGEDASCRTSVLTDVAPDGVVDSERVVQMTDPTSGDVHVLRFGTSSVEHPAGLRSHLRFWTDGAGEERHERMA